MNTCNYLSGSQILFLKICCTPLWESYFSIWKKLHYICNQKVKIGRASSCLLLKYRPLNLRPRGFRWCETMCLNLGKNWISSIKNQLTQTDSALNADQKLSKNHGDLMLPDRVTAIQNSKKVLTSEDKHFSWTLHWSSDPARMHRIIIVLLPFLISIQWTIALCKLIYNRAPLIFTQFELHGFTSSWALLCSYLKAYMLEATRTWHIQHEFSDWRCDIVCIWCNDNFLTSGSAKIKSKQFSEFGSRTITKTSWPLRKFHEGWPIQINNFRLGNQIFGRVQNAKWLSDE